MKIAGKIMKLVILTRPTYFIEEDKILTSLFEEGMDNLHLYKPESSPMYAERLLTLLSEEYYRYITVHEHFYLKSEYKLAGIHLDNTEKFVPEGYKGNVSRTCNDLQKLKDIKKNSKYVFLDNVLCSHNNNSPTLSIDELKYASHMGLIDKKVYAICSPKAEDIKTIKALGFGGIVLGNDLWNHFDIHSQTNFSSIVEHFKKIKKAIN